MPAYSHGHGPHRKEQGAVEPSFEDTDASPASLACADVTLIILRVAHLTQRVASESPRWTCAVGDQSGRPIACWIRGGLFGRLAPRQIAEAALLCRKGRSQ